MHEPIEVLLVEDDPGDVKLTEKSLQESKLLVNLNHIPNGQKAMEYLRGEADYKGAARPDLILLDLNMPIKDGRQTLKEIKDDPALRTIPVVILTTSAADTDIVKSYTLGANCYVTKPVDFEQFQKVIHEISEFWFTVVKLPGEAESFSRKEI
ncbi:MAG: response regulator [Candidatus Omnitrophica bacterium]|nr:response regulator [Candidatus Omnitrophota bacterium]